MTADRYVEVRPVVLIDGVFERATDASNVTTWGVYITNSSGLPMWLADRETRRAAITTGARTAYFMRRPLYVDELDGSRIGFAGSELVQISLGGEA